jgi:two-component system sensor histidine kinase KdpD
MEALQVHHLWNMVRRSARQSWQGYAVGLGGVALITLVIAVVRAWVTIANLSVLYLIAVLVAASFYGSGPAVVASIAAFLAYDFFFVEPVYSITIADPGEWVALFMFLLTALITGQLAAGQRRRAEEARAREREAALLFEVSGMMHHPDLNDALRAVAERLRELFRVDTVGILVNQSGLSPIRVVVGHPVPPNVFRMDEGQTHVLQEGTARSSATPGRWVSVLSPHGRRQQMRVPACYHVPLRSGGRRIGALVLVNAGRELEFTPEENRLLLAVAAQLSVALERERLRREATEAEVLRRTDELKTALLNAVSHDLRTPLASIIAAAESLLQRDIDWSPEEQRELLETILEEGQRLDQLVRNLLDLSRIEAGKLQLDRQPHAIPTLVDAALKRVGPRLSQHHVVLEIPETLPPVAVDALKIEQVLVNLLENAAKYSPPGSTVTVRARLLNGSVEMLVEDEDPGIPEDALPYLFAPFYRAGQSGDGARPQGTGLGLAIARQLVHAHGGSIRAENRREGGARFVLTLPIAASVASTEERTT